MTGAQNKDTFSLRSSTANGHNLFVYKYTYCQLKLLIKEICLHYFLFFYKIHKNTFEEQFD